MNDHTMDRTDSNATLSTAGWLVAAILVALCLMAFIWWQGWDIPIAVGYVSVKIAMKIGALVAGSLIVLAAWWRKRRAKAADLDHTNPCGPGEGASAEV